MPLRPGKRFRRFTEGGVARFVPLVPTRRADRGTSGHQGVPSAGGADSDRGGSGPETLGLPLLRLGGRRASTRAIELRGCARRPSHPTLYRLQPQCRLYRPYAQPLFPSRSTSSTGTSVAARSDQLLFGRGEQPSPSHRGQEGNRSPAARVVAEVDHQGAASDVLPGEKTPVPAIIRAVSVVAHHEE